MDAYAQTLGYAAPRETTSKRWWSPDSGDDDDKAHRAMALIGDTAAIEQRQSAWHEFNLWNATAYTNRELPGFRWGEVMADKELWPSNLRTENLLESIGESMLSKASSSPLKPTPVPHGGNWKVERAVRLLDNFLLGVWRQTKAEDACVMMFRDAFISGLGCVQIGFDKEALHVESVFFDNIIIDNRECANRAPPKTYRVRQVMPRGVVEARYGVNLGTQERYVNYRDVADGWVVVVEAWRMPDPDGKNGRHSIACCDQLVVDEAWRHDWVPLIFFNWQDRTSGFFTKGGVEQLLPFQIIQNELNDDIRAAQDICCRPRLLVNANSHIDVSQWDSEIARFVMWSGTKPESFEWKTALSELYQERERNKAAAYSHMGISEMFANADMPSQVRLDSSAGVREFRNLEDSRHLRLWSNFEAARLTVARTMIRVLATSKGAQAYTSVYHPGGSKAAAKMIPYEAVKTLDEDQFYWTLEATPLSQMSPAARRELIRDWSSRGLIDQDEARRMEGNPNLEREEDLELASADDVVRHINILEDGDYEPPTQLTNCTLGIKKVSANYHRLKAYEDVKDYVLQNHIKWVVAAVSIQQAAVIQPQPTPFAPTQGMPGTNATTQGPPVQ